MGGMSQVSRMVATVALFLLIAPQPALLFGHSDESSEAVAIEKEIDDAMENMQSHFEFGSVITGKDSRKISKAFENLSNYIQRKTNTKPRVRGNFIVF